MVSRKHTTTVAETELEALRRYRTQGSLALSAYLDLRSSERQAAAEDLLAERIQASLHELGIDGEQRASLQEDVELIQIYLSTNGNRKAAGVAVFSCAEELFWRAYLLPLPVDMRVHVGPELDVEPLLDVLERNRCESFSPEQVAV